MFWTSCLVCRNSTVAKVRPRKIVSFKYDLKGNRASKAIQEGVVCSDCDKGRFSFGPALVTVAAKGAK